jgi:hypothetical protein
MSLYILVKDCKISFTEKPNMHFSMHLWQGGIFFGSCMSWKGCRELCFVFGCTGEAVGDLVWLYVDRG